MSWSTSAHLLRVEGADLVDHPALLVGDECYYLLEYTAKQHYTYGLANDVINNLKKEPSTYRRRPDVWQYKTAAIEQCGSAFGRSINHEWLSLATLVPIPPSKTADHPNYDDRMLQVLRAIPVDFDLDIRQLVEQRQSTEAAHLSGGDRLTVEELVALYRIDESAAAPVPVHIGVVDDVLTLGAHFRAMKQVLQTRFPGISVVGFFVARRVYAV